MGLVFETKRLVEFRDTDAAGIMHFSVFFLVMEQAEHEFLRHLGISVIHKFDERVLSWPRVSAHCDYRTPVKFEEVVTISVSVQKIGTKSVTYGFDFRRGDISIAEGNMVAVCCDVTDGHVVEAVAIPDEVRELLSDYVVEG